MKKLLFLLLHFVATISFAQEKKICITIDDLPTVSYRTDRVDQEITQNFISTFKKYNIPAIGYVNERKLYRRGQLDSIKVDILVQWLESGMDLGNHTYAHYDYNKVSESKYFSDIIKGERVIKPLLTQYGKELKFFRHPYLHSGVDSLSYNRLEDFLEKNGYETSPVTIDNDDYLFAKAYHNAFIAQDENLMIEIGSEYVKYMEEKLVYFESKSEEVFGRNIPQTLLIHASLLNAHYLDELAEMYQNHGYEFISQKAIMKTPEYATAINAYAKRGHSWIFRWGFSLGMDEDLMDHDIKTPDKIIELAKK